MSISCSTAHNKLGMPEYEFTVVEQDEDRPCMASVLFLQGCYTQ